MSDVFSSTAPRVRAVLELLRINFLLRQTVRASRVAEVSKRSEASFKKRDSL